jgi:hypothetical protein
MLGVAPNVLHGSGRRGPDRRWLHAHAPAARNTVYREPTVKNLATKGGIARPPSWVAPAVCRLDAHAALRIETGLMQNSECPETQPPCALATTAP